MAVEHFDVAVVGGGPVGAALALALGDTRFAVALIEARTTGGSAVDRRPLALSYGSRLILERLGAWDGLARATPIARIHVSQQGAFGRTVLTAAQADLPALGYVVDYSGLVALFDRSVAEAPIRAIRGARVRDIDSEGDRARVQYETDAGAHACTASLVVVADGASIETGTRVREYGQSAITARVHTTRPHGNTAYERFTPEGPIALLPFADEYALVWTVRTPEAEGLRAAAAHDFLECLHERFGERLGRFTAVADRALHALTLRVAEPTTRPRTIVIGNAAQALHPVAGQGFNLGLRDAWELAGEVCRRGVADDTLAGVYRSRRRVDRAGAVAFTDTLVRLFSNDWIPLELARGVGLTLLDCVPPIKDFVVRRMVFGARG